MDADVKERGAAAAKKGRGGAGAIEQGQVTVARSALVAAAAAASIVDSKQTMPILANMIVETVDGGLALTTTDLDIAVRVVVPAACDAAGAALCTTVSARKLSALAGAAEDGCNIVLAMAAGAGALDMRAARSRFKLPVLPREDFPLVAFEAGGASFRMAGKELAAALARTAVAESDEMARYYLCGTLLAVVDGALVAAATNGHLLTEIALGDGPADWPASILPSKLTALLTKLLKECDGAVDIAIDAQGKRIRFAWDGWTVTSKLIEGNFPDWRRVIPAPNAERRLIVDVGELQRAIARVGQMASDKTRMVVLTIAEERVTVSCQSPENGAAEEDVPAGSALASFQIKFNAAYLRDIAGAASGDVVAFEFGDPTAPVRVVPQAGEGFVGVLMPVRL